jgi:hypothetical protein
MGKSIFALLLLAPLFHGCFAAGVAAVGAGAVLISQDVIDSTTYTARLDVEINRTWTTTKTTLSHMSTKPIDTDEELRSAKAEIDGGTVTVSVETYDLNRSVLKVSAKKYGVAHGELAKTVYDKILTELDKTK